MQHRVMTGAGRHRRILLQDLAGALERAERRGPDRVRNRVVGSGPAALGPHEVILAVLQQHEGSLHVARGSDLLEGAAVGEGDETGEVVLQPGDVAVPPAPVHDVVGAVTVLEDHLIDWLRAVVELVDERPSQVVLERPGRWTAGIAEQHIEATELLRHVPH